MDEEIEKIVEALHSDWEGEFGSYGLALKKPSTRHLLEEFWSECRNKGVDLACFDVEKLKKLINPVYPYEYNKGVLWDELERLVPVEKNEAVPESEKCFIKENSLPNFQPGEFVGHKNSSEVGMVTAYCLNKHKFGYLVDFGTCKFWFREKDLYPVHSTSKTGRSTSSQLEPNFTSRRRINESNSNPSHYVESQRQTTLQQFLDDSNTLSQVEVTYYVHDVAEKLNLEDDLRNAVIKKLRGRKVLNKKQALKEVAATMYDACYRAGVPVTQARIAEAINFSRASFSKILRRGRNAEASLDCEGIVE